MNWKELPLNTSKLYITNHLLGGCDIYVPIAEKTDIDRVRKELQAFADWQRWVIPDGEDLA